MKDSAIALAVAAALGLGAVPAFAQDHDGDHHRWNTDQQQAHHRYRARHERWQQRFYAQPLNPYSYGPYSYAAPGYYAGPGSFVVPGANPPAAPNYYYSNPNSRDAAAASTIGAIVGAVPVQP